MKTNTSFSFFIFWIVFLIPVSAAFAGGYEQSGPQEWSERLHTESESVELIAAFNPQQRDIMEALHFLDNRDAVVRFREISLDERVRIYGGMRADDRIILNLFEDVEYTARVRRTDLNINGTSTIMAETDEPKAYVILVTTGERSLGSIYIPSLLKYYKIISDPLTYQHYLIEMDSRDRDILEGSPPLIPDIHEEDIREQKRIQQHLENRDLGPDDIATIDVMILITPSAESWGNSIGGGIENVIAMSMVNAQLVLDNSEVKMLATLVHTALINHTQNVSSNVLLRRLTASPDFNPFGSDFDGYFEEVHDWRDEYGADLVAVFANVSDTGGLAWLLTSRFGMPSMGFSLTRVQQAATGYTHIHEMGHNMGLHHHAQQNFQPGPTQWTNWPENHWSAGWRWTGTDGGHYCSVMSYTSGQYYDDGITHTQVPYFSNHSVLYAGVPTGEFVMGDNSRTLLKIKHVIAAYRTNDLAEVITKEGSDITITSAIAGGEVIREGGSPVTQRGVVWNATGNPTVDDHEGLTEDGTGPGEFYSEITGLIPSSDYFVSAYAINSEGVRHGPQQLIRTMTAFRPTVITVEATDITHNTAIAGGDVTSDGNAPVLERGVVWSTNQSPTVGNNEGMTVEEGAVGEFTSKLTGLSGETTYYYRSYATNIMGTNYGRENELTTLAARVYPNPVSHHLNFEFTNESDGDVYIVLTNMEGQVVKRRKVPEKGNFQTVFRVTHLRSGMYILSVESDQDFPVWQVMVSPDR